MTYKELANEVVGYRSAKSLLAGSSNLVLHPVTFEEVMSPYYEGLEGDLHLYLRGKEDLAHIRADRHFIRNGNDIKLEELTDFTLQKMTLQNALALLKRRSPDSEKDQWDDFNLGAYYERTTHKNPLVLPDSKG